ncbi:hypothetical protein LCGC14_2053580 [marine sediment metagenome]|uniref:Uncharacterized protein n=1 Tax=marine sediment metagenome TaxID=412755 RepID=A0A0F9END7_9ZZZZ
MSVNITFDGQSYIVPETGEVGWGGNTTSYLVAIAAGCLQKTGGSFTLSAETDFGASFGLASIYYSSRTPDHSSAGILRLANNSDSVNWRNAANSADLSLAVNASNQLTFDGVPLAVSGGGTVNPGLTSFIAYYPANGTTVDDQTLLALTNIAGANPRVELRGVAPVGAGQRGPLFDYYAVTTNPSTQTIVAQTAGVKENTADTDTKGLYRISVDDGTGLVSRLTIGSNGLLTINVVDGIAAVNAAAFSQIKILQIVKAESESASSSTSATFTDTGLTASITPSNVNSTILVFVAQATSSQTTSGQSVAAGSLRVLRDAVVVNTASNQWGHSFGANTQIDALRCTTSMLESDSPASTSALTYKTQFARVSGSDGTVYVQQNSSRSTIILMEVNGL